MQNSIKINSIQRYKQTILMLVGLCLSNMLIAKGIDTSEYKLKTPPRIIRPCCSFGEDIEVLIIPFIKIGEVIGKDEIGSHTYLGGKNEGNGILYTYKGGFIDLGHLRDQADWTAYLHSVILQNKGNDNFSFTLGKEAGRKVLTLKIPIDISNEDAALLAGRITYDLSVWHEIATWYGASVVPMIPERYSSFSIEDDYSNQLGIILGTKALISEKPYNEAMTELLANTLDTLQVVSSVEESRKAMEMVNGEWWTSMYKYPSKNIMLKREVSCYNTTYPLLVPDLANTAATPIQIEMNSSKFLPLTNFYKLEFHLNRKIPIDEIFNTHKRKRIITNADFGFLLSHIKTEIALLQYKKFKRRTSK